MLLTLLLPKDLLENCVIVVKRKLFNLEEHILPTGLDIKDWVGHEIYDAVRL